MVVGDSERVGLGSGATDSGVRNIDKLTLRGKLNPGGAQSMSFRSEGRDREPFRVRNSNRFGNEGGRYLPGGILQ